jgi:fructokinase
MPKPRVLCLGEALWDCLGDAVGLPLAAIEHWSAYPGGAPANVACALAKLGIPAGFVGCLGQDPAGDRLLHELQVNGVNVTGVQRHATAPTRQVYVLRDAQGDRQFAAFGHEGDRDLPTTVFADTRLQADNLLEDLFYGAEYLVLGTLGLAYPEVREAILRALDFADAYYLKVILDVNWRPIFWPEPERAIATITPILERIDFLKCAREEALWLFQTEDPSSVVEQVDQLEGVLITDGDRGCRYWLCGNVGEVPAFAVMPQDTTGAGDAFVAGLIHQMIQWRLSGLSHPRLAHQAILYASAAGALTTLQLGAIVAQPNDAQIEAFLQERGFWLHAEPDG